MSKIFWDYEDGDIGMSLSDNMAIDSDGNYMMRMSDNMVVDLESGDMHFISGWSKEEEE